jgi:Flp pilus assembly CpaE family ATPase
MAHAWEPLAQLLAGLDQQRIPHDAVVDLGRRGAHGSSGVLARRADVVLLVVRANLRSIAAAHHRVPRLRDDLADHGTGADSLALVVIEDKDYKPSQISDLFGLPVLAVLPSDPRIGGALTDGTRPMDERAMKTPLMRRLATCAEQALILARTRAVRLRAPRAAPLQEATRVD